MANSKKECSARPTGTLKGIDKLVWANKAVGLEAVDALLKDCKKSVKALAPLLCEANDAASMQASFALDGMVMRAMAPDNAAKALELAEALDASLKFARDDTARCILLKCLQQLGREETIPVFARYLLKGEPMFTYALNALRRIGTTEAYDTIREAMVKAEGRTRTLLCAAALENYVVDDDLLNEGIDCLNDEDDPALIRLLWSRLSVRGVDLSDDLFSALTGLSRVDAGQARRTLIATIVSGETYVNIDDEHDDGCDCGCEDDHCDCGDDDCDDDDCDCDDDECGDDDAYARELAARFLKTEPKEAALFAYLLAFGPGEDAFEVLKQAVAKGDKIMRCAAMKLLVCAFTDMTWVERLVGFVAELKNEEARADAIRALGRSGNVAARPFIMSCINDKSAIVRAAAIAAADMLPGHNIVGSRLGAIITAGLK